MTVSLFGDLVEVMVSSYRECLPMSIRGYGPKGPYKRCRAEPSHRIMSFLSTSDLMWIIDDIGVVRPNAGCRCCYQARPLSWFVREPDTITEHA
jgi:hypothetical protein